MLLVTINNNKSSEPKGIGEKLKIQIEEDNL